MPDSEKTPEHTMTNEQRAHMRRMEADYFELGPWPEPVPHNVRSPWPAIGAALIALLITLISCS